jgi:hypothetical protein
VRIASEFVVRVLDLVEAEGRTLLAVVQTEAARVRVSFMHAAESLAVTAALLLLAGVLTVGGIGFLAFALMWWVEARGGRPLAATVTGIAVLGIAGLFLLAARSRFRDRTPR